MTASLFRTPVLFLNIRANFNNGVVCMASILPVISNSVFYNVVYCTGIRKKERWTGMPLFFIKIYISFHYFWKGPKFWVRREIETERRRRQIQTGGGLLYWPFFNLLCDSIFRALCPCFFDEKLLIKVRWAAFPSLATEWCSERLLLLDWLCLTGYLSIYNFPTPMHSSFQAMWPVSGCQTTWTAHTHASLVFW